MGTLNNPNGQEFFVMNVVVKLGRLHEHGVEGHGAPTIQEVRLFKDGTECVVTGICDDMKWLCHVR